MAHLAGLRAHLVRLIAHLAGLSTPVGLITRLTGLITRLTGLKVRQAGHMAYLAGSGTRRTTLEASLTDSSCTTASHRCCSRAAKEPLYSSAGADQILLELSFSGSAPCRQGAAVEATGVRV